jgi:exportin-1
MEAAAAKLLDLTQQPFDVALLDEVVAATYDPHHPHQNDANLLLMRVKEHPEMWTRADTILEQSKSSQGRFFGLQVLEDAIATRWKILPQQQRDGIKNYIVSKIISLSQSEESMQQNRVFLSKMNQVLVAILKQEWPHNWPSFISDIVGSSKTSEVLCENNMQILKLLSEEVFDFSKDSMTTAKIKSMKESLNEEFAKIYQLCDFILQASQRPTLLNVTLQTLQRFLTWIPLGYIFETTLIQTLLVKFFPVPLFRTGVLECLTEVASLSGLDEQYTPVFRQLFVSLLEQLTRIVSPDSDLAAVFDDMSEVEQIFIKKLALFFTGFLRYHRAVLETPEHQMAMLVGLGYLVRISEVPDEEVFKICLEYYHVFSQDLYQSETRARPGGLGFGEGGSMLGLGLVQDATPASSGMGGSRVSMYKDILTRVRHVLIMRMSKPEEVLIVEDENGEIVRETTKDTEAIAQYKTMRETLVYLTHLNYEDTEAIMLEKLSLQVSGQAFTWHSLNTLCWAIGSISGAMTEEEEKRFLVTVIKDLLNLCEMKRGKDNKAIIASNIMYVVGQYPRFLRAHWKFLRTVVNKLFEFMHELHPGVQDMACDTFLKIAQKCKRKFVTTQSGETQPFISELLLQLPTIVSDLETHQVHTFYEAVACMLSDRGAAVLINREELLQKLMAMPNAAWKEIFARAKANLETILQPETVKEVTKIMRTNVRVCNSVGPLYVTQLKDSYLDILQVYRFYSEHISSAVASQGELATRLAPIRAMRGAKKEALKLLTVFIEKSGIPDSPPDVVASQMLPPMLDPVLGDYNRCIAGARDPEVLSLFAGATSKLKEHMSQYVPRIMEAVFECTLQMITRNFEDFPEHRIKFFQFLKAVNTHCFGALFEIPREHQKLVVDSVVWAFKHTERNIAETGLEILHELLRNVGRAPAIAQGFYSQYLLSLIQDILSVMTDRLHKSGFKMHATLLRQMFHLVAGGQVTAMMHESAQPPGPDGNQRFLADFVGRLLSQSFPNLTPSQVANFVQGLFNTSMDLPTFKQHVRDFLITIKEFSVEDNADLFYEETMKVKVEQEQQQLAARLAVPGLINPHEMPQNGDDDMGDL